MSPSRDHLLNVAEAPSRVAIARTTAAAGLGDCITATATERVRATTIIDRSGHPRRHAQLVCREEGGGMGEGGNNRGHTACQATPHASPSSATSSPSSPTLPCAATASPSSPGVVEWARGSCRGHSAFQATPTCPITHRRRPSPSGPAACASKACVILQSNLATCTMRRGEGGSYRGQPASQALQQPPLPPCRQIPPPTGHRPSNPLDTAHPLMTGLRLKPSTRSARGEGEPHHDLHC
jgi:hypothetical protein